MLWTRGNARSDQSPKFRDRCCGNGDGEKDELRWLVGSYEETRELAVSDGPLRQDR